MSSHEPQFRATFHPSRGDSIDRFFPTDSEAIDWLRIQSPVVSFEHDSRAERWTARDGTRRIVGEVNRQKAE